VTTLTVTATLSVAESLRVSVNGPAVTVGTVLRVGAEIGSGGFGTVSACTVAGASAPAGAIVVKQFSGNGADPRRNADVVADLHRALELLTTDWTPHCWGVPYWVGNVISATGQQGVAWVGADLSARGFEPLADLLEDRQDDLIAQPLPRRLELVAHFAAGQVVRDAAGFVHADINPENVFVNLATGHVQVIDVDSGVVRWAGTELPLTTGKADEFLAPEIINAAGVPDITVVGPDSERWATGLTACILLLGVHPLFFLRTLGPVAIAGYAQRYTWPVIAPHDPLYQPTNDAFYRGWRRTVDQLPDTVTGVIQQLLGPGYTTPALRPDPQAWLDSLTAEPPTIELISYPRVVHQHTAFAISWTTHRAATVELTSSRNPRRYGPYPPNGVAQIVLSATGDTITLTARNAFGETTATTDAILVLRRPALPQSLTPSVHPARPSLAPLAVSAVRPSTKHAATPLPLKHWLARNAIRPARPLHHPLGPIAALLKHCP